MVRLLDELWQHGQTIAKEELKDTAPRDFKTIDAAKVRETVKNIEEAIRDKEVPKESKAETSVCEKELFEPITTYGKSYKQKRGCLKLLRQPRHAVSGKIN